MSTISFSERAKKQRFPSGFKFVAMDMSGDLTLYEKRPKPGNVHWVQGGNSQHFGRYNFAENWKGCIFTIANS